MKDLLRSLAGKASDNHGCAVRECENTGTLTRLKAFDPIDHDDTFAPLCETHAEWADERNALVEEIYDGLRECRRDVGVQYTDSVAELRSAPDGELVDGLSINVAEKVAEMLSGDTEVIHER